MISIIVAIAENGVIGDKNALLWNIKEDMRRFRTTTTGHPVVMGRKTFESIGRPLPKRTNIILTRNPEYKVKDAVVVHSIDELMEELKNYNSEEIYIIGGDSIYQQMLPYCDVAHVTYIEQSYAADSYFPNLDKDPEWVMTAESDEQTYFDITYYFRKYERICANYMQKLTYEEQFAQICY